MRLRSENEAHHLPRDYAERLVMASATTTRVPYPLAKLIRQTSFALYLIGKVRKIG